MRLCDSMLNYTPVERAGAEERNAGLVWEGNGATIIQ